MSKLEIVGTGLLMSVNVSVANMEHICGYQHAWMSFTSALGDGPMGMATLHTHAGDLGGSYKC